MRLRELELDISFEMPGGVLLDVIAAKCQERLGSEMTPVRFAVTERRGDHWHCEAAVIEGLAGSGFAQPQSIFRFCKRGFESTNAFNCVMLVPTGIGAEIGGHSGDAAPVARLLAGVCDQLVVHPNVVNACDINEMTENMLYVEGSVISRLLMGTVGLSKARSNRILTILEAHDEFDILCAGVNAVNAARTSGGINCSHIETVSPHFRITATSSSSGRAAGAIENFELVCDVISKYRGRVDAIALSTVVNVPRDLQNTYFRDLEEVVNPYGGPEAILTHGISTLFDLPAAHSPMYESLEVLRDSDGIMEPRKAAEGVSVAYLHCVLKGLSKSPRICTDGRYFGRAGCISAENVSCLVIPIGCLGLPTLAALEQGIPVIAVRENSNIMKNDLGELAWGDGQYFEVDNYLEAAGVMVALRSGISPQLVRRPALPASHGRISGHHPTTNKRLGSMSARAQSVS